MTSTDLNDALSEALKEHTGLIQTNESSILSQKESVTKLEKDLSHSSGVADKKMEWLEEEVNKIRKMSDNMQVTESQRNGVSY